MTPRYDVGEDPSLDGRKGFILVEPFFLYTSLTISKETHGIAAFPLSLRLSCIRRHTSSILEEREKEIFKKVLVLIPDDALPLRLTRSPAWDRHGYLCRRRLEMEVREGRSAGIPWQP